MTRSNFFFTLATIVFNIIIVLSLLCVAFNIMNQPADFAFTGGILMILAIIAFETFVAYPLIKKLIKDSIKKSL